MRPGVERLGPGQVRAAPAGSRTVPETPAALPLLGELPVLQSLTNTPSAEPEFLPTWWV